MFIEMELKQDENIYQYNSSVKKMKHQKHVSFDTIPQIYYYPDITDINYRSYWYLYQFIKLRFQNRILSFEQKFNTRLPKYAIQYLFDNKSSEEKLIENQMKINNTYTQITKHGDIIKTKNSIISMATGPLAYRKDSNIQVLDQSLNIYEEVYPHIGKLSFNLTPSVRPLPHILEDNE